MAKYPRSIRKQFQLQRDGSTWQVWGFRRGTWQMLGVAHTKKEAESFRREQTEYYRLFLEYQRRSESK